MAYYIDLQLLLYDTGCALTCRRGKHGVTVGYQTCDREVVGSTPGRVTINWLLLGWVTVGEQVKHLWI